MKVIMLQGPPGSGKTFWANALCAKHQNYFRVNKDDIRLQLLGVEKGGGDRKFSKKDEQEIVLPERDRQIEAFLRSGFSVIVDDTNLQPRHETRLRELASLYGAEFETRRFDTDLEECLRRNAARPENERVPEKVIRSMHKQMHEPEPPGPFKPYEADRRLPPAIIFDLDGTTALSQGCGPNGGNLRYIFDFAKCAEDIANPAVADVIGLIYGYNHAVELNETLMNMPEFRAYLAKNADPVAMKLVAGARPLTILFVTGREEKYRPQTQEFLAKNGYPTAPLYMRPTGDTRKDWIIKGEIFDAAIRNHYAVAFTLDDRSQVVKFWRSIGVSCFQVSEGNF